MVYFLTLCLIASVIFYGVGKRAGARKGEEMGYLDALFLGVTSATGAGLGNVCPHSWARVDVEGADGCRLCSRV